MRINETPEHKQIKILLQDSLRSWLDGADIAEYPHSGQEVDVFQVLYSGTTILVEIIWNTGYTHFLEDLDIIQNSTARIKIVVVNPAIFSKEKYVHHFDKTRIAEIVKGYMVSRLLDGNKVLNDTNYLKIVKDTIFELLSYVSLNPEEDLAHFSDLKNKVINPAIVILGSQPDQLPEIDGPTLNGGLIDIGLLNDLCVNHYPQVKKAWNEVVKITKRKNNLSNEIDQTIGDLLRSQLGGIGLEYKPSIYDEPHPPRNAIPIREVTNRLRQLIENNTYPFEIENRLVVRTSHENRSDLLLKGESHPEIYAVREEEKSKELAHNLKQIFDEINSNVDIQSLVKKHKESIATLDRSKIKLEKMLNELANKTKLNIVSRCAYLSPRLEAR